MKRKTKILIVGGVATLLLGGLGAFLLLRNRNKGITLSNAETPQETPQNTSNSNTASPTIISDDWDWVRNQFKILESFKNDKIGTKYRLTANATDFKNLYTNKQVVKVSMPVYVGEYLAHRGSNIYYDFREIHSRNASLLAPLMEGQNKSYYFDKSGKPNGYKTFGTYLMLVKGVNDNKLWIVPVFNDFNSTKDASLFLERI